MLQIRPSYASHPGALDDPNAGRDASRFSCRRSRTPCAPFLVTTCWTPRPRQSHWICHSAATLDPRSPDCGRLPALARASRAFSRVRTNSLQSGALSGARNCKPSICALDTRCELIPLISRQIWSIGTFSSSTDHPPCTIVRLHPLLLQGAVLASVGSFGVFHRDSAAHVLFSDVITAVALAFPAAARVGTVQDDAVVGLSLSCMR